MKAQKIVPTTSNPRRRGTYNPACDVCARKKTKCDGIKPVCQPCESQGRQKECTWTKNPVRKPRTEASFEAMHKLVENLRQRVAECQQCHQQHRTIDFLASRPSDSEALLDVLVEPDSDSHDQTSDDGSDPAIMAICIPPLSLQEEGGRTLHLGDTTPFRFAEPFTQPSRFPALAENPEGTYILLVEGVESRHYNPAFDWSRHLSPAVPLDRRSHDKALDLLFKFFTSWCFRIVPALFLRDMYRALSVSPSQTPPKTPHYSPMLHNALVALALAFLDEPKFTDFKSRQYFANHAKSFIEAESRNPNISVVQAFSILSSFHSTQGDQTLGYMYFGMSAHMSQTLGLDTDCSEWVKLGQMDENDRLDYHWANWTVFTHDACWSLYVGRDSCVPVPIDPDTPGMISASHIDPEFDEMPWFYPPAGIAPQPNDLTKTFEATCRLLIIARRIMDVVKGLNKARIRPLVLDSLIGDIDVQLNMWRDSLTAELEIAPLTATPHKLMLHLAYWWLFIQLHEPFFNLKSRTIHSTDREIDHVKWCRRAAGNIMDLLLTWRNLYSLRYCPITLIQIVFSAGTVYLLTAIQASSGIRTAQKELQHSLDQETLVQQYLQEIGLSWKCATDISVTLRNRKAEYVMPVLERNTIPIPSAGLRIDSGDDDEEIGPTFYRSSSKSSRRHKGSITKLKHRQAIDPRTKSSGSSHSSLSTSPNHTSFSLTSPAHVSSAPSQALTSPSITIFGASSSLTHAAPSAPIAIPSQRSASSYSSSPSSFPSSQGLQPGTHSNSPIPSSNSSPLFPPNYWPSFSNRGLQGYSQPSNYGFSGNDNSNLFSGDGNNSGEDFGNTYGSQCSFLKHNFQPSSSQPSNNRSAGGYPGMLGGQTLSEPPFVGSFTGGDSHSPHFSYSSQDPFATGFPNHAPSSSSLAEHIPSSSLAEHVPSSSHSDYDAMDFDNTYFGS